MECRFYDDREADDNKEDGEDSFPGDVVGENILGSEEENDTGGESAEAHKFIFFSKEADDARDDDEEGPPAVKKDVKVEKSESFAAEENAKCDNGDAPDDWF